MDATLGGTWMAASNQNRATSHRQPAALVPRRAVAGQHYRPATAG
jgi:hypothetical protein